MPQSTIRFRIRPDGRVEEEVQGLAGNSCHQLTQEIEARLGTVQQSRPTSEAFLAASTSSNETVRVSQHGAMTISDPA